MRKATDVFGEWAEKGKDRGMEKPHAIPVDEKQFAILMLVILATVSLMNLRKGK